MLRPLAAILPALLFTGCLQSSLLIKVKADGSGTIENQTVIATAALAQLRQLAGAFGGANAAPIDPFSEQQARDLASQMGDGVALVSSMPLKTATGEGRESVYSFRDVKTLRISQAPPSPGTSIRAGGRGGNVTIDFDKNAAGNLVLTIHSPGDPLSAVAGQAGAVTGNSGTPADQIATMRQMLGGLRISVAVQPMGRVIRTSSPFVDGQTVTIFDLDLDALLNNEAAFTKFQGAKSSAEAADALKGVPGVKVNLDPEITIEFAP